MEENQTSGDDSTQTTTVQTGYTLTKAVESADGLGRDMADTFATLYELERGDRVEVAYESVHAGNVKTLTGRLLDFSTDLGRGLTVATRDGVRKVYMGDGDLEILEVFTVDRFGNDRRMGVVNYAFDDTGIWLTRAKYERVPVDDDQDDQDDETDADAYLTVADAGADSRTPRTTMRLAARRTDHRDEVDDTLTWAAVTGRDPVAVALRVAVELAARDGRDDQADAADTRQRRTDGGLGTVQQVRPPEPDPRRVMEGRGPLGW